MTTATLISTGARPLLARIQLASLLEHICQAIEPTASEYADAEAKYGAVASWLAGSDHALLQGAYLYPQGSFALGTAIRPLAGGELDVDVIIRVAGLSPETLPSTVKALIGRRLREPAELESALDGWEFIVRPVPVAPERLWAAAPVIALLTQPPASEIPDGAWGTLPPEWEEASRQLEE